MQDVYDLARGGVMEIAYTLKVHYRTVERWRLHGVPDSYWSELHRIYGVTPYELFKLNGKIRGYRS